MNRDLWTQYLSEQSCPEWVCPACNRGSVALIQKSLTFHENVKSRLDAAEYDEEMIQYFFTAWAKCKYPPCEQMLAIAGKGSLRGDYDEDRQIQYKEFFRPMICYPMPNIITVPDRCPEEVTRELRSAFELFWSHPAACAGRIRVALECLLNYLRVPKRKRGNNGKYYELKLHHRIEDFAKSEPAVASQLMALKWLGNSGSHTDEVGSGDLLDAFEIIEHALEETIDQRSAKVAVLAKKLTKKHKH